MIYLQSFIKYTKIKPNINIQIINKLNLSFFDIINIYFNVIFTLNYIYKRYKRINSKLNS